MRQDNQKQDKKNKEKDISAEPLGKHGIKSSILGKKAIIMGGFL